MNLPEYERMFEVEEYYWWYVGMRQIMLDTLEGTSGICLEQSLILDAGCGTGGMLARLNHAHCAVGVDYSAEALRWSTMRQLPHVRFSRSSITHLPLKDNTFDIVICFDVLCCVRDDQRALEEFARVLKPNGILLLSVPAFDFLRSQHDVAVSIFQRYTTTSLRDKLAKTGLQVERFTYANALLFPLAVAVRLIRRNPSLSTEQATSDLTPLPGPLNWLMARILLLEARWLRHWNLPVGLTALALARK